MIKEDNDMIIDNKNIKFKVLEAISSARDSTYYRILSTGELQINHKFQSHVFLAYVRGNWFASYGQRKCVSIEIPEKGLDLFAYGNNSLWIENNNEEVDVATPVVPLDSNTRIVLFAFSGKAYDVIIADGSRCSTVISTSLPKTPENDVFLIMSMTSLIRQYDEKAADDILKFWFSKKSNKDDTGAYRSQIQFEKKEPTKDTELMDMASIF